MVTILQRKLKPKCCWSGAGGTTHLTSRRNVDPCPLAQGAKCQRLVLWRSHTKAFQAQQWGSGARTGNRLRWTTRWMAPSSTSYPTQLWDCWPPGRRLEASSQEENHLLTRGSLWTRTFGGVGWGVCVCAVLHPNTPELSPSGTSPAKYMQCLLSLTASLFMADSQGLPDIWGKPPTQKSETK